ncbi:MAG: hypothetical protein JSR45_13140 [Proteobacteria bacterium]|nr:hypothetical protein [Pseudomonadota bacterium]
MQRVLPILIALASVQPAMAQAPNPDAVPMSSSDDCMVFITLAKVELKAHDALPHPLEPMTLPRAAHLPATLPNVPTKVLNAMRDGAGRLPKDGERVACEWQAAGISQPVLSTVSAYPDPCARRDYVPVKAPNFCVDYQLFRPRIGFTMPTYSRDGRYALAGYAWNASPEESGAADCVLERHGDGWRVLACFGAPRSEG